MADYERNHDRGERISTMVPPRTNGGHYYMGNTPEIAERIVPLSVRHLIILVGFVITVTSVAVIGWFELRAEVANVKAETVAIRCSVKQVVEYVMSKQLPRPGDC